MRARRCLNNDTLVVGQWSLRRDNGGRGRLPVTDVEYQSKPAHIRAYLITFLQNTLTAFFFCL